MIACNRGCGEEGLNWKVINGKFKLFGGDNLLHICNDGKIANQSKREIATAKILTELGITDTALIPDAEESIHVHTGPDKLTSLIVRSNIKPNKMFTINTTANGIAITGDDKHNAIYLPKVAVPELIKALVDFI